MKGKITYGSKIPRNVHDSQLLRSMERRRGIHAQTTSQLQQSSSEPLSNKADSHEGNMSRDLPGRYSQAIIPRDAEIPDVEDPNAPSINMDWHPRIQRWWWRVRGGWRRYWGAIFPKPTTGELESREWEANEKELDLRCRREARQYMKLITGAMLRIGNEITGHRSNELVRWKRIARDQAFTKIILALDVERVPSYLFLSSLKKDPRWKDGIEQAIGRLVAWEVGEVGALLTIYRPVTERPKRRVITVEELIGGDDSI